MPERTLQGSKVTVPAPLQVPLWVKLDGEHVRIKGLSELKLACQLATIYHNTDSRSPLHDGWEEKTLDIERRVAATGLGSESSEDVGESIIETPEW